MRRNGDRLRVVEVLERGIADGTHIGAQLYVSHRGAVVADLALGRARSDVDMRTDTLMTRPPWEKSSESILVKGQGPAMQETRALRN